MLAILLCVAQNIAVALITRPHVNDSVGEADAMEHVFGIEASLHDDAEARSTEFVYDSPDLDSTAVVRTVFHKIIGTEMVTMVGLSLTHDPSWSHKRPCLGRVWGTLSPS